MASCLHYSNCRQIRRSAENYNEIEISQQEMIDEDGVLVISLSKTVPDTVL